MFPNIWAVGRNYIDHAHELNNQVPTSPLIFLKSGSCAFQDSRLALPLWSSEIHYELEIALQLNSQLQPHKIAFALDLTDRQAQNKAKENGLPWTQAKSFKNSCPIGELSTIPKGSLLDQLQFQLEIDGEICQNGHTGKMIFPIDSLVKHLQNYFPLQPGDLILTGTPSGVGPLREGQILKAYEIFSISPLVKPVQWEII